MKKLIFTLIFGVLIVLTAIAQPPQAFKYQAVVRDNTGEIISNQLVGVRISIHDATAGGTIVYQETFSETTNQFGLVNLKIGNGTPTIGTFNGIDWSSNSKFLEIEIDPAGGTSYSYIGTSQLLSVPYALHSQSSDDVVWEESGGNVYYNAGNVGIGTSTPLEKLDLNGNLKVLGNAYSDNTGIDLQISQSVSGKGGKVYIKAGDAQNNYSANHWGGDIEIKAGNGNNNSGGNIRIEGGKSSIWTLSTLPTEVNIFGGSIDGAPSVYNNSGLITIESGKQLGANSPNRSGGNILLLPGTSEGSGVSGNVGIGTSNPVDKLDVNGNLKVLGTASSDNIGINLQIGQSVSGKGGKVYIKAGDAQSNFSSNHWGGDVVIKAGTGSNNSGGNVTIEGGKTSIWTLSTLPTKIDLYGGGIDGAPGVYNNSGLITIESGKQLGANSPNRSGGNILLLPGTADGSGTDGNVGIGTTNPGSKLSVPGLPEYADNATAIAGGLSAGDFYRTGDLLKVVH
ncbi:MAG: hypothetical protein K8R58_01710 [Bacteroidales bacterium]|nr:hypothetical protein [Bacteroidales bacterium]